nr:hypothetical protein [uncultured Rhodopila sp.]
MSSNCIHLVGAVALSCLAGAAFAQPAAPPAATAAPPSRPSSVKADMVPSLIVLNARGASLQGDTLTLTGVSASAILFADRPVRAAGHLLTRDMLEEWAADGSFAKDPPNATVSVLSKDGISNQDIVAELTKPKLEADRLSFTVKVLEGNLSGADGPASVFIDIIGMPWTPLSFAGVARRSARRAYWYGAAAAPHYPPYGYPPYGYAPPYPPPPYPYPY